MSKAMSIGSMVVAAIIALVFTLDIAIGKPFHGASSMMDICFIVCALILGYLSFDAFRDSK